MRKKYYFRTALLCALFAALSAVLSQIAIPMAPVPLVLTQVSVFLAAGLLGWKWAAASQLVFLALGAAGLPVFAGMKGGLGAFAGPTGGFLLGYVLAAFLSGLLMDRHGRSHRAVILALLVGIAAIYFCGVLWLCFVTRMGLKQATVAGVLPFLPGDFIKAAVCVVLIPRLYRVMKKQLQ